jgi:hypothetical protein
MRNVNAAITSDPSTPRSQPSGNSTTHAGPMRSHGQPSGNATRNSIPRRRHGQPSNNSARSSAPRNRRGQPSDNGTRNEPPRRPPGQPLDTLFFIRRPYHRQFRTRGWAFDINARRWRNFQDWVVPDAQTARVAIFFFEQLGFDFNCMPGVDDDNDQPTLQNAEPETVEAYRRLHSERFPPSIIGGHANNNNHGSSDPHFSSFSEIFTEDSDAGGERN